jgi:hypothetical protein
MRAIALALVLVLASTAVAAESPRSVMNALVLEARESRGVGLLEEGQFDGLPVPAQLAMYAGVSTTMGHVELGDKSPLKKAIGEDAFDKVAAQYPRLQAAAAVMRESLTATSLANLEKREFDTAKTVILAAGGLVLASGRIENKLEQGTMIFSARAILGFVREGRVIRKLTLMSIDPRLPAEVRQQAGTTLALAAGVEIQQQIAEAKFVASLDGTFAAR